VSLFSTQGCGYCSKTRTWLAQRKVPYTEYDLERDPKASAKLQELGKRAGVAPGQLQGVPILFVDDRAILGWDPERLGALLGT
jgi:glutaredoxin